jgi:hypothetical protein
MKFNLKTTFLMSVLQDALKLEQQGNLIPLIEQIGLDGLLDPELFKAARYFDRRILVKFLSTLGMENSDERVYYQRWLASSQLLDGQHTLDSAARLCAADDHRMIDFYKDVLMGVSRPSESTSSADWLSLPCSSSDMLFATEFFLDNLAVQWLPKVLNCWRQLDNTGEPWLWMCRTIAERVEFAKSVQKAYALANAFEFLFEEIDPQHQTLFSVMAPHLVNLYLKANRPDDALLTANNYVEKSPGPESSYWLMMCCARLNEFPEAIRLAEAVVDATIHSAMVKKKQMPEQELVEEGLVAKTKHRFDINAANESLKRVNRILRERGLQPFLMSGVLLGYVREGQLLPHDKDLDIGLIGWEQQFDVAQALQQSGHYYISWRGIRGDKTFLFDAYDLVNGITIDFFFFHPHAHYFLHGIDYKYGFTQNLKFSAFGLKEVDFLGDKFLIPENAEQNLYENYGDWRRPQSSYVVTVESPALVDKGSLKHQFIALMEIMSSINKYDSPQRARRVVDHCRQINMPILSDEVMGRLNEWLAWRGHH